MKVYKNFLDKESFKNIKNLLTSEDFPWFLTSIVHYSKGNFNSQLVHIFYVNNAVNSNFFNVLKPIYKKLNFFSLLRLKANFIMRTENIIEHTMHTDYVNPSCKIYTGILYINTNNGYTKFSNGKIIKSEENKYIEFDSQLEHTGTSCTDEEYRIVLNFNYIK